MLSRVLCAYMVGRQYICRCCDQCFYGLFPLQVGSYLELSTLLFGLTLGISWTSPALPYELVYWEIFFVNVYCQFVVVKIDIALM